MATERHLLVIYYNFPPVKVPGAVRIFNLCQVAQHHFSTVQALTTSNRRLFQQEESLKLSSVPVTEVPAWDLRRFAASKSNTNNAFISTEQKQSFWGRILRKLVDSFPFNILVGDGGLIYIIKGYVAGKKIVQQQGITHVFSTFRPYSDHIIAYLLKKRFPSLIWIADFRDLHVDPINKNVLLPSFQLKVNRWILKKSNLLTTVSQGLEHHLKQLHNATYVLYNGINSEVEIRKPMARTDRFTICYTGSLFFDKRDPSLLFSLIAKLQNEKAWDIEITYAGRDSQQWQQMIEKYGLEKISKNYGIVPLEKARTLQAEAHINLLLTYSSSDLQGNLTGKLYEYLAAGRPIITIINGSQDEEIEQLIAETKGGLVVYNQQNDANRLEQFLKKSYHEWETTGFLVSTISTEAIQRFYWPNMFEKLLEHIDA